VRKFEFEVLGLGMNNSDYPGAFTEPVKQIIKSVIYGKVLHLYSGSSFIGDERIDLEHPNATKNVRVEDFINSDSRDWDWVILDPPYNINNADNKLRGYGETKCAFANMPFRRKLKHYFQKHTDNILWLDFCAPTIRGFYRKELWLCLPGGFHTVRVLSWLKKEMDLLL